MSPLRFCFVLHLHQPVGNFDHVFRQHADDVYTPFFDYLEAHDLWPIGLHVSGPLVEWLGDNDAALHDRIGRMAADGRIELLSAGWYEPILAALPTEDRATQLAWCAEELRGRFGVTPTGLWLTERVWEPDLPRDLAEAGIEYVLVDDHMARSAGVEEEALRRPLRTEAQGRTVDLLTIDERLRYLIPFRPAEEIEAHLRSRHAAGDDLALIGDDGEKFGGWPRTREWLYEGGWLEAFAERMDTLRAEGVVRLVTPAGARAELAATGPVYLPSGSYPEMEGWALGGHWKGFLTRYEEANRIHKRAAALSEECRRRGDPHEVRRALGRAQCNDAYWHGVFGGIYMKHLREGVRRELCRAERGLRAGSALSWRAGDLDGSGRRGWWAQGEAVSAWVDPRYGGTISELVWLERGVDVLDVLTRRREAYHVEAVGRAREAAATAAGDGGADGASTASIHDIEAASVLERLPPIDPVTRTLVIDRVLGGATTLQAYEDGAFEPVWIAGPATAPDPRPEDAAGLRWNFASPEGPRVEKSIAVHADGTVVVSWTWSPDDFPAGSRFAPELSLGTSARIAGGPESARADGPAAVLEPTPATEIWRYPIVTVSKCPDGFEAIVQGESITPLWPISLGRAQVVLRPA